MENSSVSVKSFLHDYFWAKTPNKVCVIYDTKKEVQTLTYGEVDGLAGKVEEALKGVGLGDQMGGFVGVMNPHLLFAPSIQLGVLRSGRGFFNLEGKVWPEMAERGRMVFNMELLLVCKEAYLSHSGVGEKLWEIQMSLKGKAEEDSLTFFLVRMGGGKGAYPLRLQKPFRFAYAMETSGTTGEKKMVLVPHRCISPNIAHFIGAVWGMEEKDVAWGSAPLTFDPSVCDLFCALGVGATIVYAEDSAALKSDGEALGSFLLKHSVSVIQTTPSLLRRVFRRFKSSKFLAPDHSPLKILALGGEKCLSVEELQDLIPEPLFRKMRRLVNLYGLTEMSCWGSFDTIDLYGSPAAITIGTPLMETRISLQNSHQMNEDLGEIVLKSSTRICTVLLETGTVLLEDSDGKEEISLFTGDLGKWSSVVPGRIEIFGRKDNVAKRSGMKIPLILLERRAMELGLFQHAEAHDFDGKIHLVVIPKQDELSCADIEGKLRAEFVPLFSLGLDLPPEFYPNSIIAVSKVPTNDNGKIDLQSVIKEALLSSHRCTGKYAISRETVLHTLFPVWTRAVGTSSRSLSEVESWNFFESGGNSQGALWMFEAFFSSFGLYGSPLLPQIQEEVMAKLVGSTFAEFADILQGYLEGTGKGAELTVISGTTKSEWRGERIRKPKLTAAACTPSPYNFPHPFTSLAEIPMASPYPGPLGGMKLFEFDLNMCVDATVAVSEGYHRGIAVVGSHSGCVIAVDTNVLRDLVTAKKKSRGGMDHKRAVLWTRQLPSRVEGDALICKDGIFVYIGCYNKKLYKLSLHDGRVDGYFKCKGEIRSAIALKERTLTVIDVENTLYCVDAKEMRELWHTSPSEGRLNSIFPPVIVANAVIANCIPYGMLAYSIRTGEVLWRSEDFPFDGVKSLPNTQPIVWDTPRGPLVVYGSTTGLEIREAETGAQISRETLRTEGDMRWLPPVRPQCPCHSSELVLASNLGQVFRLNFDPARDSVTLKSRKLRPSNTAPTYVCVKASAELDDTRSTCYLISKPKDSSSLVAYQTDSEEDEEEGTPLQLPPDSLNQESFSRPLWWEDLLFFGGRDNKLHIGVPCENAT